MNSFYCRLADEALLHITGVDALTFLQGQTSCDTRKIDDTHALPGVYCTPQGRVVCDFMLVQLEQDQDHYALRMRSDIVANSALVFGKYIVFSKATLDYERQDWQLFALWGEDAGQALESIGASIPGTKYGSTASDNLVVVQIDDSGQQFECYFKPTEAPSIEERLGECSAQSSEEAWRAQQLLTGIARIEGATVEEYVPQTLNYDLTGHISFDKGCYTGQEVVARLHYRGTPKRRTCLARLPAGATARVGDTLYSSAASGGSGDIVNLASTDEGVVALVNATEPGRESGLHLDSADGPPLELLQMPYSLTDDADTD